MKYPAVKQVILGLLFAYISFIPTHTNAAEVDNGLIIVDRKPWKISWVQEDKKTWVLTANFDKGQLRTYFSKAPPEKGFGLSHNNKPIKQEFEFYRGKKFTSTNSQYEQWPDGAKGYSFLYEQKFEREGNKLELTTTAIIEEVGNAENEIRYALFRVFD